MPAAAPFWERLGFERTCGESNYILMTGWGCEVHLTLAGGGPWSVPEQNNPFGVFIRTPDGDAISEHSRQPDPVHRELGRASKHSDR